MIGKQEVQERYVTDTYLAERFSVSRNTIWRWVREGHLPKPVKFGPGCTRWQMSKIEEFEARQLANSK